MGTPYNIKGSASQLFYQDTDLLQYKALLAISVLPHPDRTILSTFIEDAVDPEYAARYFLDTISSRVANDDEEPPTKEVLSSFLTEWICLINKLRPTIANDLPDDFKAIIYERDGGRCCVTGVQPVSPQAILEYAFIVSPLVFRDRKMVSGTILNDMLSAFFTPAKLESLCSLFLNAPISHDDREPVQSERIDNVWLLSKETFKAVESGYLAFAIRKYSGHTDPTLQQSYYVRHNNFLKIPLGISVHQPIQPPITLQNRTPNIVPLPNPELIETHARLAKALAWIEVAKHMQHGWPVCSNSQLQSWISYNAPLLRLLRRVWVRLPQWIRVSTYEGLTRIGSRFYGATLSQTVHRLPFNLYLRRGSPGLASKYRAEARSLDLVERYTEIPAPRVIDTFETPQHSYLLMTRVPGQPVGQILDVMTDGETKQVVSDLKKIVSELLQIPNAIGFQFRICNSLGEGFLDWRIPDSQHEDLRFKTEADFNEYLTRPFWDETRKLAAKSHDTHHKIVFTHGDLNMRNILAINGKVTGIVDWENAGWFPEYWEFTKAHYTARSSIRWLADIIDQVFEGYREELKVENMLSDLLGPF